MLLQVFSISFLISLIGTIPPATINITAMQLSLKKKAQKASALSLGAAMIDTVYAGLAILIQIYLEEKIAFTNFFYLITTGVLAVLGIIAIRTKKSDLNNIEVATEGRKSGFVEGILLGILNPLAMPFWLGVTSYLKLNGWIDLSGINYWGYVAGVFLGEISLLMIIVKVGTKFTRVADNHLMVNTIPGVVFLILALVNFVQWISYYL